MPLQLPNRLLLPHQAPALKWLLPPLLLSHRLLLTKNRRLLLSHRLLPLLVLT
jgi:hypothetical protein